MYFGLDPESLPKSTWQIGQATERLKEGRQTEEDERRRPRGVPIGREGDSAWLDGGGEERGREEGEGSRGELELEIADGEARESETRGPETAVIVVEREEEMRRRRRRKVRDGGWCRRG